MLPPEETRRRLGRRSKGVCCEDHFAEWQYASCSESLALRILAGEVLHPQFFFRLRHGHFHSGQCGIFPAMCAVYVSG